MSKTQKHILLAVVGKTPQVLTETLYALIINRKITVSEIKIFTTSEGLQVTKEHLLNPVNSKYHKFCYDYNIDPAHIKFDEDCIIVAHDEYGELEDIRKKEHCDPLVNTMTSAIKKLTDDPDTTLHCVLAGGRKTMSVYFAFALQFFGRLQDKLYHIIVVPSEFENHFGFFYPPPEPQTFVSLHNKEYSTADAEIILMEIPYVHLYDKMSQIYDDWPVEFYELVIRAQNELEQLPVVQPLSINLIKKQLKIGGKIILLTAIEMAFYYYYVERSLNRAANISSHDYENYFESAEGSYFSDDGLKRVMEIYKKIASQGMIERFEKTLENGSLEFVRACQFFSRIKRKIRSALNDDRLVENYFISGVGCYGKSYGIKLDKSKIIIRE